MYIPTTRAPGISSDNPWRLVPHVFAATEIEAVWPDIEGFIARSVDQSNGTTSVETIFQLLMQQEATMFATLRNGRPELVLVVRLVQYAKFVTARVIAMAGKNLKEAKAFLPALEAWALTQGAIEIEAWSRPAVARLLQHVGMKERSRCMVLNLRGKLQ